MNVQISPCLAADEIPSQGESLRIIPAVLCGGAGLRLWPASRESMPKQFIELVGHQSTFQSTLRRVDDSALFGRPLVLSHSDSRFIVAEQLKGVGISADIILEPNRRDTAIAVAIAAYVASQSDKRALVLTLAADHVIDDAEAFRQSCRRAAPAAAAGYIMTLVSCPPSHPSRTVTFSQAIRSPTRIVGKWFVSLKSRTRRLRKAS